MDVDLPLDHFLQTQPAILDAVRKDPDFLYDLYAALCNTEWVRVDNVTKEEFVEALQGENTYSVSWRTAGAICAQIYNLVYPDKETKDYSDYYCAGCEGRTSDKMREIALSFGWEIRVFTEGNT